MQHVLVLLLLAVGVGFLAWIAWVSIQSLLQAAKLRRLTVHEAGASEPGRAVGLFGPIQVGAPIRAFGYSNLLWYRCVQQERRGSGKNRRWVTVDERSEMAVFSVRSGDRDVEIGDHPTEIQNVLSRTAYGETTWATFFGFGRHTRTLFSWLPVPARITVLGRLDYRAGAWRVVKDGKLGLFLSPHDPGRAAGIETWKGIGGLAFVTAVVILGLCLYFSIRR